MNWVTGAYADDMFISFVWTVLLQITIVTLVAWTVVRVLGRSRPAVRQAVGRCGLALVLLSPVLAWTLPQLGWRARWLPAERWWSEETTVSSAHFSQEAGPSSARLDPPRSANALVNPERLPEARLPDGASAPAGVWAAAFPRRATLRGIIMLATGLWLVGILVLTGRWWHGYRRLKRVCWDLIPLDETACEDVLVRVRQTLGISRLPEFRVSLGAPMPLLVRPWRPLVILPTSLVLQGDAAVSSSMQSAGAGVFHDRLHDALVHECAHVLQHDLWVSVGARVATILYWPHPGVYWLNRALAQSREEVCDNYVLRRTNAVSYAQTLLGLAEQYTAALASCQPLGVVSPRWTLEQRIAGLLDPRRNTSTHCGVLMLLAISAVTCTASLLVGGVHGGPPESPPVAAGGDGARLPSESAANSRPPQLDPQPEPFPPDAVLARVGDQVIRTRGLWLEAHVLQYFDLQDVDKRLPRQLRKSRETIERQLDLDMQGCLERIIETKLLYLECLASLPDERRQERLAEITRRADEQYEQRGLKNDMKRAKVTSHAELEAYLKKYGSSLKESRQRFLEHSLAHSALSAKIPYGPEATEQELQTYYRQHSQDFDRPAAARWEKLTVCLDRFANKADAVAVLEKWRQVVASGEPWATVAQRSSHGPDASDGGYHDWTSKGSLRSQVLDNALFTLPIGPISANLEDGGEIHLVRVQERREAGPMPFGSVREEIRERLHQERCGTGETADPTLLGEPKEGIPRLDGF